MNSTGRTLGQIANETALRSPYLMGPETWDLVAAAVRDAVIDECSRNVCRECQQGWPVRYDVGNKYYYHRIPGHEEEEIGCRASALRAMVRPSNGPVENPSVIETLKAEIRTLRNHAVVLAGALDAYRFYIDAADFELQECKLTRDRALERARDLDPYDGVIPSELAVTEKYGSVMPDEPSEAA